MGAPDAPGFDVVIFFGPITQDATFSDADLRFVCSESIECGHGADMAQNLGGKKRKVLVHAGPGATIAGFAPNATLGSWHVDMQSFASEGRCEVLSSHALYDDPACGMALDHEVLLVGFGVDGRTGLPYYKLKNSWGTSWGEGGFMRIKAYSNTCGLATGATT